jgi:hypothetical protein
LHKNSTISIQSWVLRHPKQVFFIQKASQANGIHVPFTFNIQTPTQCQAMLTFGHNGAISMDVTFGTNDVKYHLFTLISFNVNILESLKHGSLQVDKQWMIWWNGSKL